MNSDLRDRIQAVWGSLCKTTVPSHNKDTVLRIAMQAQLKEMVHSGLIRSWYNITVERHGNEYRAFIDLQPAMSVETTLIVVRCVLVPEKPQHQMERFNFDE